MNVHGTRDLSTYFALVTAVLAICGIPDPAHAVIPPDLIISLGSQVAQMYAIGGAIILSLLVSVVPTLSAFFQRAWVRHVLLFLSAVAILAIWSYALLAIYRPDASLPWAPPETRLGTTAGAVTYEIGRRFYSDRFVFVGRRTNGNPVALDIYANRMEQEGGGFVHYYSVESVDVKKGVYDYREQLSPEFEILPHLIFDSFDRDEALDHSSRETFNFSLKAGGRAYEIQTSELASDFITKNEPHNTEYMSVGEATVRTEGETIKGHILFQRIYSSDYRLTIFFEGFRSLRSEATQVILWDPVGNFYMADSSNVFDQSPYYSSHFWALQKEADGRMRKAFSGLIRRDGDPPKTFAAEIPDLGISRLTVELNTRFERGKSKGYAEGTISDTYGERTVYGIASYNVYGNR